MGLERARKQGKRLGRPRVHVDANEIAELRAQGRSWREIREATGVSKGTAQRAVIFMPRERPDGMLGELHVWLTENLNYRRRVKAIVLFQGHSVYYTEDAKKLEDGIYGWSRDRNNDFASRL